MLFSTLQLLRLKLASFTMKYQLLSQSDMTAGERGLFIQLFFMSWVHYGLLRCVLLVPEWRDIEFLQ